MVRLPMRKTRQNSIFFFTISLLISTATGYAPSSLRTRPFSSLFSYPDKDGGSPNGSNNVDRISGYTTEQAYSTRMRISFKERWSDMLYRREQQREQELKDSQEDGYADMFVKKRGIVKSLLRMPLMFAKAMLAPKETGTLILVRHGESLWNANKTFTGWADVDLSDKGVREAEHAARLLLEGGYEVDVVFTSRLKRAIRSVWIILQELNEVYLPVFKSWRLNERMYGALTGLSKVETAEQLGQELVQQWRGSLKVRPPALTENHRYWPGRDRTYFDLSAEQIPKTESLEDCMERTAPVWEGKIKRELRKGRNVMVVAHANTLRGLVKKIDGISEEEIQNVAIPTGIPIIYKFDKQVNPIIQEDSTRGGRSNHMKGVFLSKPGLLTEALQREEEWRETVPGYDSTMGRTNKPMTHLERSLFKLQAERQLGKWAGQFIKPEDIVMDDGNDGNGGKPIVFDQTKEIDEDDVWQLAMGEMAKSKEEEKKKNGAGTPPAIAVNGGDEKKETIAAPLITTNPPCVTSVPSAAIIPGVGNVPVRKDGVLVIIRHGKTEHNKLKLFTGWFDAPLAQEGIDEAREAGKLLKLHGFEFDVVYTSWLSRAVETAWYVMDEMDCLWLPIIKSWRLNERMYGELTGLSKNMVAQRHGEKQFKAWRRGYKTPPPPVSSFSQHYPGNDKRYKKYLRDVRFSFRESVIRSIESGRLTLRRKLPKSESLKDCMDRTIPYFAKRIVPEALDQGKRVLISSSENAIRGLLMHLCEIPEDQITGLEIPNGLPLIFDLKSKCVKLLDDGTGRDPLEVYNFGNAANYLFRPCQNEDGSPDEECDITYIAEYDREQTLISLADQRALDDIKKGVYRLDTEEATADSK